jgi:cyclopropane fatty-acyl-phospholipid synthase-like methyltransferase
MPPPDESLHLKQVRSYYDRNTARFLNWGRDEGTANLHAALWPPGVRTLAQAMQVANELAVSAIEGSPRPVARVLDLGCGVGAGLFHLDRRLPRIESLVGVTLSPVQAEIARRAVPAGSPPGRFRFEAASFTALSPARFAADFAIAIESFAHGPDPSRFFACTAGLLPEGGRLLIIDDCLAGPGERLGPEEARLLARYRENWLLPGLRRPEELRALAARRGLALVAERDLTGWLRLGRPRDRAIALAVRLFGGLMAQHPYGRMLVGGDAKQRCYRRGICRYRLLVFEKRPGATP